MDFSSENLRIILGIKLKQLRNDKNMSLKELSELTQLSISYLSEIEKGKKYPKPEKIMTLARALGTTFDDLVTLKVDEALDPITAVLNSPGVREFPFTLFGIEPQDVLEIFSGSPAKAGALLRTLLEILRGYDMTVEHFLFAALRSFQKMHLNYFEDIEDAVDTFISDHKWKNKFPIPTELLQEVLTQEYRYNIDETTLSQYPELLKFRTVLLNKGEHATSPRLLLNPNLVPRQKAFIYGRELGYNVLKLAERALTSSWVKVESFDQVLNNFRASYFSGALLMNRESMEKDLTKLFQKKHWDAPFFLSLLDKYDVTPEMFLYRMTEILPKFFGLSEIHFLRFSHETTTGEINLTKFLNMSHGFTPYGLDLNEHYCRRWLPVAILKRAQQELTTGNPRTPIVQVQRSLFVDRNDEYFVITLARPFALQPAYHSSVSIGFLMNETFKETVRFWNDSAIERNHVNETCERCSMPDELCSDRRTPPVIYQKEHRQQAREKTLEIILSGKTIQNITF